jgi:hypothetical protein
VLLVRFGRPRWPLAPGWHRRAQNIYPARVLASRTIAFAFSRLLGPVRLPYLVGFGPRIAADGKADKAPEEVDDDLRVLGVSGIALHAPFMIAVGTVGREWIPKIPPLVIFSHAAPIAATSSYSPFSATRT